MQACRSPDNTEAGPPTPLWVYAAKSKSLLEGLQPSAIAALEEWLDGQAGDPLRGGAIDVMAWPGWARVMQRRFHERFTAKAR